MSFTKISYSQLTKWRGECVERFGTIHELEVFPSFYEECRRLHKGGRVLDVGAGVNRHLQKLLELDDVNYFPVDNDPAGGFEYDSVDALPAGLAFDLVVMNQLLEHLTIDEAVTLMEDVTQRVADGGYVFISIPNVQHPVRYWGDSTHVTHWAYEDMYGLTRHVGLDVVLVGRSNKYPLTRNPIKLFVIRTVCDAFRIDWCDTIFIVATKRC